MNYYVLGLETCPTTGRLHIQGYFQLMRPQRMSYIRQHLWDTAHYEPAVGTPDQNAAYCKKDNDWEEWGVAMQITHGGARNQKTDWSEAIALSKKGELSELESKHPRVFFLHYTTVKTIMKDYQLRPPESANTRGVWIWGEAGSGKSRFARTVYNPHYAKMANKWFDGYQDEPYIILDDVGPDQAKSLPYHLKIWTDRYPFVAEIKNGSKMISPRGFIITSQYAIESLFADAETRDALLRRCTVIHIGSETPAVHPFFVTTEPKRARSVGE